MDTLDNITVLRQRRPRSAPPVPDALALEVRGLLESALIVLLALGAVDKLVAGGVDWRPYLGWLGATARAGLEARAAGGVELALAFGLTFAPRAGGLATAAWLALAAGSLWGAGAGDRAALVSALAVAALATARLARGS
jgi:hypothetical protein